MTLRFRCNFAACALVGVLALASAAVRADPPRVVATTPEHADLAVDPELAELRITFSEDMAPGGRSICGGGPSFPEIAGEPRWTDARTLALPVRLEPGREYALSINCPSFRNFQSRAGEPAEIYPIRFRTRAAGEPAPAPLTPEQNDAAIAELRRIIDEIYSHRDRLSVDWPALFARHRDALRAAETPATFARIAAGMLRAAEDLHLSLAVGDIALGTHRRDITPNFRDDLLGAALPGLTWRSPCVGVGQTGDGFGYIVITTWGAPRAQYEAALDALREFAGAPGIVVDVRPNAGGDELIAREFAAHFVSEPAIYARSRYRDLAAPGGFTAPIDRVITPADDGVRYTGPVAVLMGPACMSSCESFLLMMKQAPRCALVGAPSFGSSGNPRPFPLGNGVTAIIPTWQDLTPDGHDIEGRGIAPDIAAALPAGAPTDTVLAAGLDHLRGQTRDR